MIFLAVACTNFLSPARFAHLASDFGGHTLYQSFMAVAAVLMLWHAYRKGPKRLFWWPPVVALCSGLCTEGLKRVTHLPRPDGQTTGFPSGHTNFAFALAWLLTQIHPRFAPLWYTVAVSIGWSRVEGDAHFPYQVLCGAVLGTLIAWGISRAVPGRQIDRPRA